MFARTRSWSQVLPLIAGLILVAACGKSGNSGSNDDPCEDRGCTKLVSPNASRFDYFGASVAVGDDVVVVGAPLDDEEGVDAGAAYVYRRDGTDWDADATLVPADSSAGDRFGNSVSLSDDVIVVGAVFGESAGTISTNFGAAYVFRAAGGAWVEEARLEASNLSILDAFGTEVSVSGDVAVVGAPLRNSAGVDAGAAYVYTFDGVDWNETDILTASDAQAGDAFGTSVAIDGDVIVVGAPGNLNNGATAAFAADIDGDGDLDVVTVADLDDQVAWHENTDGDGAFGAKHFISTGVANGLTSVFAADLDGDDDVDVLTSSANDDTIAWYENTDGDGTFGAQQVISTGADRASSVIAVDIDGDDDNDVVSASFNDDTIAWYENTDGNGTFGAEQVISTAANGALAVTAEDIDGDDDLDLVSASFIDDKIAWYENTDGDGAFGAQQVITTGADGAVSVVAVDIDGDDDIDVVAGSENDNELAWFENTDGAGDFGAAQQVTNRADNLTSVVAADFDGDGDADLVATSMRNEPINQNFQDDLIEFFANEDGLGDFSNALLISLSAKGVSSALAADLDDDGDLDLLFATSLGDSQNGSHHDDKIAWHPNLDGEADFGDEIIISTPGSAGAAYAFRFDGVNWIEEGILSASDLGDSEDFGHAVAVSDDVISIGTSLDDEGVDAAASENPGAVYVFRHDGANWLEEQILDSEEAAIGRRDIFGIDVAISATGDTIVAGSRLSDDGLPSAGFAHVLGFVGGMWTHESGLAAPDARSQQLFGDSVAISADSVVVGATFDDTAGERAGAVYVFER